MCNEITYVKDNRKPAVYSAKEAARGSPVLTGLVSTSSHFMLT